MIRSTIEGKNQKTNMSVYDIPLFLGLNSHWINVANSYFVLYICIYIYTSVEYFRSNKPLFVSVEFHGDHMTVINIG